MRIIIGSESFFPNVSGVAVSTWNLARYLAVQGHQVLVLAPAFKSLIGYQKTSAGFSVYRLPSFPNPLRKGFRITVHSYKKILDIVQTEKPQVIHLQDPAYICSCLAKASRLNGIPLIASHHFTADYVLSYFKFFKPIRKYFQGRLPKYLQHFYAPCQYVICPSETVRQWLISIKISTPATVVSNGVNLTRFQPCAAPAVDRTALGLPDLPLILYVGRIDQDKNLDTLLEAIPLILKNHPACFVLCGGGNLLEKFRKSIAEDGLSENVTLLGELSHHSHVLPGLYQLSACFVMPSCIETQSIATMEAMASGLPVVAAAAGALPELVRHGETGYLFEPGNAAEFAASVGRILSNPAESRQMGQKGRKEMIKHDLNHSKQQIMRLYEEVILHATE